MILAKKRISMRFDEETVNMLEMMASTAVTIYYDRNKTWLTERAIRDMFEKFLKDTGETKEETSSE